MNTAMNSSQTVIDLKGVTFRYSQGEGVCDIDLRIQKGEFAVIEGPTGAGKTTLVRLLSGELPVQAGRGR